MALLGFQKKKSLHEVIVEQEREGVGSALRRMGPFLMMVLVIGFGLATLLFSSSVTGKFVGVTNFSATAILLSALAAMFLAVLFMSK